MVDRQTIINKAREYLGTPWHHIGRLKGVGVDCIGLVSGVAQELGLTSHDLPAYSRFPDGVTLIREFDKCLLPKAGGPEPGDVGVFRIGRLPTHTGIFGIHPSGKLSLIHTYTTVGKVVEHVLDAHWERRIVKVYVFPGVC